jgi:hypothetical protein
MFVLGDRHSRFYDNGFLGEGGGSAGGYGDFALIQDFQPGIDRLQIHGGTSQYFLGNVPASLGLTGMAVFHDSNRDRMLGLGDELIAVVQSGSVLTYENVVGNAKPT